MSSDNPPLLTPQNRKLRHLRGIYLRNLTFARPALRTVDDSEIAASSAPSAAKKGKRRRGSSLGELGAARSSESLRPGARRGSVAPGGPAERQRRLEGSVEGRLADGFFSLHCEAGPPVYLSEVVERASNFNFRLFDLLHHDPTVTRSPEVTVKFWAKRHGAWSLLLEDAVDLRTLHYVGTLEDQHFPPNSLVFHLADGMYSADVATRPRAPKDLPALPTSSYNALMRLATLDSSIQDALATHHAITAQINSLLESAPPDTVPQAQDRAALAARYVQNERRALTASQRRKDSLRASIASRRAAIREGRALQARAAQDVAEASAKLSTARDSVAQTGELIRGQRRRVVSDLGDIFRVEPVPGGAPLSFRVCGIPLPNTTFEAATSRDVDEDAMSAALGHVALMADILQYYLSTPLPYPITPLGSRSSVRDDISRLAEPGAQGRGREFPLYLPRGGSTAGHFRFEYAWFLLNKDVEALCVGRGLRVVDIRETLPNLKYLLYVCCAGEEEVPERKRGGVRGLWGGEGTDGKAVGDERGAGRGVGNGRGDAVQGVQPPRANGDLDARKAKLPFREEEVKLTLRTKGLRENVSK